jgi:hypothetical protein
MELIFNLKLNNELIAFHRKVNDYILMDMTYGKKYEVFIGVSKNLYYLNDDEDDSIQLPRKFFSTLEEWRELRINILLNE